MGIGIIAVTVGLFFHDFIRTFQQRMETLLTRYHQTGLGGEAISLSAKWPSQTSFTTAGYASIITNSSYNGGFVRQADKFSFSRVFQAGHAVQAFQPETVSQIFNRVMSSTDVATGKINIINQMGNAIYRTSGPKVVRNVTETLPAMPEPTCYTLSAGSTCSDEQIGALEADNALVKDFVVVQPNE